MNGAEILLVDDDPALLRSAARALALDGLGPLVECSDPTRVRHHLESRRIALVVVDLSMPRMGGREVLALVRADFPDVPVLVMTGSRDLEVAVQCMQEGAQDYLVKPVADARLCSAVRRALARRAQERDIARVQKQLLGGRPRSAHAFPAVLTQDRAMAGLLAFCEAMAPSEAPLLVEGEPGTGKSLLAAQVHAASARTGPCIAVALAGTSEADAAALLFAAGRAGAIARAAEGTLVLDGVDALAPATQLALVPLLEDGSYRVAGTDAPRRSRARIVATCTRPLSEAVEEGSLRRDLYYRLHRHVVRLPPLRERFGDLPLLLPHFLGQAARELGKPAPTTPVELLVLLRTHGFPGNLRELADLCREAVARHGGRMLALRVFREHIEEARARSAATTTNDPEDPEDSRDSSTGPWGDGPLPHYKDARRELLREAMRRAEGIQGIAAGLLGMKRTTFNAQWLKNFPATDEAPDAGDGAPGDAPGKPR